MAGEAEETSQLPDLLAPRDIPRLERAGVTLSEPARTEAAESLLQHLRGSPEFTKAARNSLLPSDFPKFLGSSLKGHGSDVVERKCNPHAFPTGRRVGTVTEEEVEAILAKVGDHCLAGNSSILTIYPSHVS